jgi:hypothetical protein
VFRDSGGRNGRAGVVQGLGFRFMRGWFEWVHTSSHTQFSAEQGTVVGRYGNLGRPVTALAGCCQVRSFSRAVDGGRSSLAVTCRAERRRRRYEREAQRAQRMGGQVEERWGGDTSDEEEGDVGRYKRERAQILEVRAPPVPKTRSPSTKNVRGEERRASLPCLALSYSGRGCRAQEGGTRMLDM